MASSLVPLRCRAALGGVLLAASLAACKDAPTVPSSLQQLAGGEDWVALPAPADLPGLATWLPYVERSTPEGREAYNHVQHLSASAARARAAGRLGEAADLDREAERVAVLALARYPEPWVLQQGLYAVDHWCEKVRSEVALEGSPAIADALGEVMSARALAVTQLASGDTTSAVLHLASASERIREFTPTAVALRVLSRVERSLDARERDPAVDRALHLLASARQELLSGDPRRALRRALYALQLAHGNQVPADPEDAPGACPGEGC